MSDLTYRRLRAPTEDGAALIDPPLAEIPATILRNQSLPAAWEQSNNAASILALRQAARTQLFSEALAYTSRYRDATFVPAINSSTPFILAGHQPELFHPGVWFKNFLASTLAEQTKGVAINLIVDNDVVHGTSIRVPITAGNEFRIESVPYDEVGAKIPYEERRIESDELFSSFSERVRDLTANDTLIVKPLWQAAHRALRRGGGSHHLGQCIAEARHALEADLGLGTLELPLHAVCQSRPFREFILQLLLDLPRLHDVYNRALAEYRTVNHVRSHSHPVPDLAADGDWLEAPLWLWTTTNPHRWRVFVRRREGALEITDRGQTTIRLSRHADNPPQMALTDIGEAESRGIKLRPRALVTTMYARLVLSDLFVHGIGGAKYDELTDAIIRRFFGIQPPSYVTATATFRLPIERPQVAIDDVRSVARKIRDVRYRPEALLHDARIKNDMALSTQLTGFAAEKRDYLAKHDLRRCPQHVFDHLDSINRAMHMLLQPVERELRTEHSQLLAQLQQAKLLGSREFSFVLFPSEILPARLLDLCKVLS
jgi:hypothetical protein